MSAGERLPGTPVPMHKWPGADGLQIAGDAWGPRNGRLALLPRSESGYPGDGYPDHSRTSYSNRSGYTHFASSSMPSIYLGPAMLSASELGT